MMNIDLTREWMEFLYRHRSPSLPAEPIAEVLDTLIWCLEDNGSALLAVREEWLQSTERDRVAIALAMEETFPFKAREDMERVLADIERSWPEFAERCHHILEARRKLRE